MYHFILTNGLRQTYFFTIGRNLMYYSFLTNAFKQTYLYK